MSYEAVRNGITLGTRRQYAEQSAKWVEAGRSEDVCLQRIWNLAGDVTVLFDELAAAEARVRELEALLQDAKPYVESDC